ncbi:MAG: sigma-70 family RNA polymerase sigma factor [Gemmataceae bacterium]|nr:sigma-70 family RNA polymerase sigma factor [Gemmataceae bacterium]
MTPTDGPRPDSAETIGLLDRAAAGDPAAANELLARHRPSVRAFVDLHLGPDLRARVDASDVAQEALAELARRLPDYLARDPMPFHLWARKTAYERLLNARRAHRAAGRDVAREAAAPDHSSVALARTLLAPGPTPSEAAAGRELEGLAAAAVEGLAEADREILLLRHAEDLPYDEIGALLGIDPAAARKRYGRALVRLQQALADRGILGDP